MSFIYLFAGLSRVIEEGNSSESALSRKILNWSRFCWRCDDNVFIKWASKLLEMQIYCSDCIQGALTYLFPVTTQGIGPSISPEATICVWRGFRNTNLSSTVQRRNRESIVKDVTKIRTQSSLNAYGTFLWGGFSEIHMFTRKIRIFRLAPTNQTVCLNIFTLLYSRNCCSLCMISKVKAPVENISWTTSKWLAYFFFAPLTLSTLTVNEMVSSLSLGVPLSLSGWWVPFVPLSICWWAYFLQIEASVGSRTFSSPTIRGDNLV